MSLYSHCVKHGKEYLLREWDTEKNAPLTAESSACTSTEKVWWKCEKGHSWQTQISSRAKGNSRCPVCLREKVDARMEKRRAETEKKRTLCGKSKSKGEEEK